MVVVGWLQLQFFAAPKQCFVIVSYFGTKFRSVRVCLTVDVSSNGGCCFDKTARIIVA
jgi:hypothetical protein